jgi:hypothetical protein
VLDVPFSILNRNDFAATLLIIPGPKEPSDLTPYMAVFIQEMEMYKAGGDHSIPLVKYNEDGSREEIACQVVFSNRHYADIPATQKACGGSGHTGFAGCPRCTFRGCSIEGLGGVKWLGYTEPRPSMNMKTDVEGTNKTFCFKRALL